MGLNAILIRVRLNLQYAIDAKKVDLRVDKLPTVMGDATALTEVFHNLISNAIKYNDNPAIPVVGIGCEEKPECPGWPGGVHRARSRQRHGNQAGVF